MPINTNSWNGLKTNGRNSIKTNTIAPWPVKLAGKGDKAGLLKNAKGLVTLDEYLSLPEWNLDAIHARAKKLYEQIRRRGRSYGMLKK